jgi:hypothetical protein
VSKKKKKKEEHSIWDEILKWNASNKYPLTMRKISTTQTQGWWQDFPSCGWRRRSYKAIERLGFSRIYAIFHMCPGLVLFLTTTPLIPSDHFLALFLFFSGYI